MSDRWLSKKRLIALGHEALDLAESQERELASLRARVDALIAEAKIRQQESDSRSYAASMNAAATGEATKRAQIAEAAVSRVRELMEWVESDPSKGNCVMVSELSGALSGETE